MKIKEIAILAGKSESRIRQLLGRVDSICPVRRGKQVYRGRTHDEYDEEDVKRWLNKIYPVNIPDKEKESLEQFYKKFMFRKHI